jgi:hypothetical protein
MGWDEWMGSRMIKRILCKMGQLTCSMGSKYIGILICASKDTPPE